MIIRRLIALLVLVIIGSIAAQDLYRALAPVIPVVVVLVLVGFAVVVGISLMRSRY